MVDPETTSSTRSCGTFMKNRVRSFADRPRDRGAFVGGNLELMSLRTSSDSAAIGVRVTWSRWTWAPLGKNTAPASRGGAMANRMVVKAPKRAEPMTLVHTHDAVSCSALPRRASDARASSAGGGLPLRRRCNRTARRANASIANGTVSGSRTSSFASGCRDLAGQLSGSYPNSRSSCEQRQALAIFAAHRMAASRDGSCRTQKPPSNSFVWG